MTLWVSLVAFALAAALGLIVALGRASRFRVLREIATFYVEIVRGIPILVLLFYIAFVGAPQLVVAWNRRLRQADRSRPVPGPERSRLRHDLAGDLRPDDRLLGLPRRDFPRRHRGGAARPERGGGRSACRAWQTFRFVVLPQAVRIVMPPLGNDFVAMVKDSALVSSLGVQDITQLGKVYSASTFLFFETYNVVAFLYLVMTIGLSLLVRALEGQLKATGGRG